MPWKVNDDRQCEFGVGLQAWNVRDLYQAFFGDPLPELNDKDSDEIKKTAENKAAADNPTAASYGHGAIHYLNK